MAHYFPSESVSEAWYQAANHLLSQPNLRSTHLVLEVTSPLHEIDGVRAEVDQLFPMVKGAVSSNIERVADTIFPQDFYDAGEERAMEMLFERRAAAREFEEESVPKGNYFDRMCAYPLSDQTFNQLEHVVGRLRGNKENGITNSNQCEVGVSDVSGLRIQTPGVHRSIMGFPCLSHVSVTLAEAKVNLAATYRAQDFTGKGYGNLLGLGRLADFLAKESGFAVGEVLCIATGAILEKPPSGMAKLRGVVEAVGSIISRKKQ